MAVLDPESQANEEHWRREGLRNIKPDSARFGEFPEGWDAVEALRRHVASLPHGHLVDIGCGYGRLCRAFDPAKYLGVDVNPAAVEAARRGNPGYRFETASYVDEYPEADLYLAYTVFLHIPDTALRQILSRICRPASHVVVAEILKANRIDSGATCAFRAHAVYPRTRRDFESLFDQQGFACWEEIRRPYLYYGEHEISFLLFRKRDPAPVGLREFPASLSHPGLQFEGIFEDGWVAPGFRVRLLRDPGAGDLRIQGMLPAIHGGFSGARITVSVESEAPVMRRILPGAFLFEIPASGGAPGPKWIDVRCDSEQLLPKPDGRTIGFLLHSIGFGTSGA